MQPISGIIVSKLGIIVCQRKAPFIDIWRQEETADTRFSFDRYGLFDQSAITKNGQLQGLILHVYGLELFTFAERIENLLCFISELTG